MWHAPCLVPRDMKKTLFLLPFLALVACNDGEPTATAPSGNDAGISDSGNTSVNDSGSTPTADSAATESAPPDPSCPAKWTGSKSGLEAATEVIAVRDGKLFLELDRTTGSGACGGADCDGVAVEHAGVSGDFEAVINVSEVQGAGVFCGVSAIVTDGNVSAAAELVATSSAFNASVATRGAGTENYQSARYTSQNNGKLVIRRVGSKVTLEVITADVTHSQSSAFTTGAVSLKLRVRCNYAGLTYAAIESVKVGSLNDEFTCNSVAVK